MQTSFISGLLEFLLSLITFTPDHRNKDSFIQRMLPGPLKNNAFVGSLMAVALFFLLAFLVIMFIRMFN